MELLIMIFFKMSKILVFASDEIKLIFSVIHIHIQNSGKLCAITEHIYEYTARVTIIKQRPFPGLI